MYAFHPLKSVITYAQIESSSSVIPVEPISRWVLNYNRVVAFSLTISPSIRTENIVVRVVSAISNLSDPLVYTTHTDASLVTGKGCKVWDEEALLERN
jgi:hypothetical protein